MECNYFSQACPWRDNGAVWDAGCNFTAVSIGSTFVNLLTEMGSWLNLRVACWNLSIRLSDSSLSLRPPSLPERAPFQCSPSSSPSSYSTLQHLHRVYTAGERCSAAIIIKQAVYKVHISCFVSCAYSANSFVWVFFFCIACCVDGLYTCNA